MMKQLIYKPTQNRKTQEIISIILEKITESINIIFTDNLCMLGSQTGNRIIKEISGCKMYKTDDIKTITIHCESVDIDGVSRKQIATHVLGLINHDGIRNIITLTNSVRLPQIRNIIELLIAKDSWGRDGIVPGMCPMINLYFDEADKTIKGIAKELDELLNLDFINDYYITATPKKVLKKFTEMRLYPVQNTLDKYINLQYANWINIGSLEYLDSLREMLNIIKRKDRGTINPNRFIFAPGINRKDSHYEIGEEATNVFKCISIIVNSDGFQILLPGDIHPKYLSECVNSQRIQVPKLPDKLKDSLNMRNWNKILQVSGGERYYNLNFNKKSLIHDNENEFWKIMEIVRNCWVDNPLLVTGSRCIERGITIQNPFNSLNRFTDGMLHCEISRGDSGSQMAGRFTLTYNGELSHKDFIPITIYSNEKTKLYMINQEKKAMYAVELSVKGKDKITYNEWRNYERIAVLGHDDFGTFKEALKHASTTLKNKDNQIYYNENKGYLETDDRLGSCNMIKEGEYKGFRRNSFDTKEDKPIHTEQFKSRKIRHLCWNKDKTGNAYRIWAVYSDLKDSKSIRYHLCYTPLALHKEMNEETSDNESA